jgi:phosphotransferase system HPr (HPr) family protein
MYRWRIAAVCMRARQRLIRQTAQGFKSQSQLHFAGKSAPCNSLIGLMGLAVGEQDEVQVSCQGPDAEAALQALLTALATALPDDHHASGAGQCCTA